MTPNQVWQQVYTSLQWLQGQTSSSSQDSLTTQTQLVLDTALNGAEVLSASNLLAACTSEIPLLRQIAALPISYSSDESYAINARLTGLLLLQQSLTSSLSFPNPTTSSTLLASGSPAIPDIGLLNTFMAWNGEPTPSYYSTSGFVSSVNQYSSVWQSITNAVSGYYASAPQLPLDMAVRTSEGIYTVNSIVSDLAISLSSNAPSNTWNTCAALPSTLSSLRIVRPDVSLGTSQSALIVRAFCLIMAIQLAQFAMIARGLVSTSSGAQAISAISTQNQGLMDIASANLGSFEDWNTISNGIPAPWGAGAIAPGTTVSLVSGIPASTQSQILGTDIDLGPQNSEMPAWTGDFQTISGVNNYSAAIGRRLATPLGALIYHPSFGSRIPPELGQILSVGAQALITAYGKSAISSDPRTQQVLSATTQLLSGAPNAVEFFASVQPIGPGLNPIQVNEVLAP